MKKYVFIILLVSNYFNLYAQDYADELNNLKGNVRFVSIKIFRAAPVSHDKGWRYDYTFNHFKKVETQKNYHNNKLKAFYKYLYKDTGLLISEIDSVYSNATNYKYAVNNKNLIIFKEVSSNAGVLRIEDSFKYDNRNNLISFSYYTPPKRSDTLRYKIVNEYSQLNKKIASSIYSDSLFTQIRYQYNKQGDVSSVQYQIKQWYKALSSEGYKFEYKIRYAYDSHNNWIKRYIIYNDKEKLEAKRKIKYKTD